MRVTVLPFACGWLAILGIPPFSGFFSKDKIIEAAFGATTFAGHEAVWAGWIFGIVTMVGAGITAFYMSRLFFMTFHGTARWTPAADGSAQPPATTPARHDDSASAFLRPRPDWCIFPPSAWCDWKTNRWYS